MARRHLGADSENDARITAMRCLAKYGNESDIGSVAKLLNDDSIVYEFLDRGVVGQPRSIYALRMLPRQAASSLCRNRSIERWSLA